MAVNTIDPFSMSARNWIDGTTQTLDRFGALPIISTDDDWREWALVVVGLPALSSVILPDPYQFDDWRAWAMRFNELIESWSG